MQLSIYIGTSALVVVGALVVVLLVCRMGGRPSVTRIGNLEVRWLWPSRRRAGPDHRGPTDDEDVAHPS